MLSTRVSRVFWGVTAGSNRGRCGSFILDACTATSVAECVLGVPPKLRLVLGVVLRSWVLLQVVRLHLHRWGNARDTRQRGQLQKTDIIKIRRSLRFKSEQVAPENTSTRGRNTQTFSTYCAISKNSVILTRGSVPILGAHVLFFLLRSAWIGSSRKRAFS